MKRIVYFILIIVLMLHFSGCDKNTSSSNKKLTYSGIVKLIDLEGNELVSDDVTVAVFYKDINDFSWDYRLNEPILVTETDDTGHFSYNANENNSYITVFLKEGYSIKEIRQSMISNVINLYQDIEIEGTITSSIELNGTSDLVIVNDAIFIDNGYLSVLEKSKIRINPGVKVISHSNINFNNGVLITSNDKMYSFFNEEVSKFMSFEIAATATISNNLIKAVRCSFTTGGFIIQSGNVEVTDCLFSNSSNGLHILNSNNYELNNITAQNIYDSSFGGIHLEMVNNVVINGSRLEDNYNGVKVTGGSDININNCSFKNNERGYLSFYSTGNIDHNLFLDNNISFELLGNKRDGILNINSNVIENSNIGVYEHNNNTHTWSTFNTLLINNNNFIEIPLFFKYYSSHIAHSIDATNNYFDGLSAETDILSKIIDIASSTQPKKISIVPFKTKPIPNTGIDGNE